MKGGWVLATAALLTGCSSAPTERVAPADEPEGAAPEEPPDAPRQPPPEPAPQQALELARSTSGVTVLVMPSEESPFEAQAELCLCLPAGRLHGRPGLAVLAVEALVAVAEGAGGRPALRSTVQELGGTLHTRIGLDHSWILLRVPAERWEAAIEALVAALTEPATTRQRLDRLRADVLLRYAEELRGGESHLTAAGGLLFGDGPPARQLDALQDRDPAEILLFQRRYFRPEGSVLAVRTPLDPRATVARTASDKLGGWNAAELQRDAPREDRLAGAVHWIPSEGECRAVLLLALPDPLAQDAAGQWVLQECLTMGGVGGRLERALIGSGGAPLFEPRFLSGGTRNWLALTAVVDPGQVQRLWQILRDARSSLAVIGPSESERSLATRRARLSMLAQQQTSFERMQLAIRMTREGLAEDPLPRLLASLEDPALDLEAAKTAWLALPVAMVVLGGKPVEGEDVVIHTPATGRSVERLVGGDSRAQIEDARPYLDKAIQAMGGPHKLGAVIGYRAVAEYRGADGPTATETIELKGTDLRRTRVVLGTTVRTVVEGGKASESVGDETVELEPLQVAELLREANRNPLMLLSANARGQLLFRLVSVRRVDDRDMAVLEAVRSLYTRLRLHIDLQSGLPRMVESWREDAVGPIYLRELYSDFRNAGGLRVPFHRVRDLDDGSGRVEIAVTRFEPLF